MRVLAVHEAGSEQQPDRDGRDDDEQDQRAAMLLQRRPHSAQHEADPEEQPDEQVDLPEPAEVHVLVALMAEPEISSSVGDHTVDGQPLAGERAGHDHDEADE